MEMPKKLSKSHLMLLISNHLMIPLIFKISNIFHANLQLFQNTSLCHKYNQQDMFKIFKKMISKF
jgi:hypothetical protein